MDIIGALTIIMALAVAYMAFVGVTYWLARWMFPKIDIEDERETMPLSRNIQRGMRKSKDRVAKTLQQRYAVKS